MVCLCHNLLLLRPVGVQGDSMEAQDRSNQREPRQAAVNQPGVRAELDPDAALLRAIAEAAPENPLHTPAFAHAQRLRGRRIVAFLVAAAQAAHVGCTGFIAQGRLHRDLEIPSAPAAEPDHPIWEAIGQFCSDTGVTRLRVQSLGSQNLRIPCLGRTLSRSARREYVMDLRTALQSAAFSSNHRRNVRRAQRSGICMAETADPTASETHVGLIDSSMSRRQEKGEQASTGTAPDSFRCLLQAGAGVIFQARTPEGAVVSSLLVLLSERGAYYHSAGTSPEGMRSGASQFLVAKAAELLRGRGMDVFNLGGAAAEQDGLARFKLGFGATPVELEAASFDVASGPRRGAVAIANGLRSFLRQST